MYEFIKLDEIPVGKDNSIQTILNGVNLDGTIHGFRTLAVHGRDLIGRKVSTQDYENMGGSKTKNKGNALSSNKFLGSALPSRVIKVDFILSADTNKEFREVCEMLNYLLHNEEMSIQFTDDLDYGYIGTLSTIEDINSVNNSIYSSFYLECSDPFKYSIRDRIFNFETFGKFNYWTLTPSLFSKITINLNENTSVLKLTNATTGDVIILNDSFVNGDEVIIDIDNNTITKNTTNIFGKLDLTSDLEFFGATFNDDLLTNVSSSVEIKFKERRL